MLSDSQAAALPTARADMVQITLLICTYNGAARLPATLKAIAAQQHTVSWEVLLVDNASTDSTAELAERLGNELDLPLRVVKEPEPGKHHALRTGIRLARGEIVSIIDDDNLVHPGWVAACIDFMNAHPRAGIVGGRVDPLFEDPSTRPPDFEQQYAQLLAVYNLGPNAKRAIPGQDPVPVGAGMTIRAALLRQIMLDIGILNHGHVGEKLSSGEDLETAILAHRMGWELWYEPAMRMDHVLPPHRLQRDYIDRLMVDSAECYAWLGVLLGKEPLSRLNLMLKWGRWMLWSVRYAALRVLPVWLDQRLTRRVFYRRYYAGHAAGYRRLLRQYTQAQDILEAVRRQAAATPGA